MLYQSDHNFEICREHIGKIPALMEESSSSNIAIICDFNAAIDTHFDVELQELCTMVGPLDSSPMSVTGLGSSTVLVLGTCT